MLRLPTTISTLALGLAILLSGPAAAAENVLRFTGISGGAVTMDPHSYDASNTKVATKQVYEALLDIDSNLALVPQLALAWSMRRGSHQVLHGQVAVPRALFSSWILSAGETGHRTRPLPPQNSAQSRRRVHRRCSARSGSSRSPCRRPAGTTFFRV